MKAASINGTVQQGDVDTLTLSTSDVTETDTTNKVVSATF